MKIYNEMIFSFFLSFSFFFHNEKMADTKVIQPEKKEKKKDKKKKKGTEPADLDKFKPVANPDFNPNLIAPFSVTATNKQEQWTISSNKSIPPVDQKIITPSERQGHAAETYFPRDSYSHLDPSKSTNAYSAFNELQQKFSPPLQTNNKQQPQQYPSNKQPPPPHQINKSPYNSPPMNYTQQMNNQRPMNQQPQPQRHPQPQQQQRPTHLKDGVKILSYARASWPYTAQV